MSAYHAGVTHHRLFGRFRNATWPEPFATMRRIGVEFVDGSWTRPSEGVHVSYDYSDDPDAWDNADDADDGAEASGDDLGEE